MNLMEGNHRTKENSWREDLRSDLNTEQTEEEELEGEGLSIEDLDEEPDEEEDDIHGFWHKPYMTTVLLAVILVLLICIIVLLLFMPGRRQRHKIAVMTISSRVSHSTRRNKNRMIMLRDCQVKRLELIRQTTKTVRSMWYPQKRRKPMRMRKRKRKPRLSRQTVTRWLSW